MVSADLMVGCFCGVLVYCFTVVYGLLYLYYYFDYLVAGIGCLFECEYFVLIWVIGGFRDCEFWVCSCGLFVGVLLFLLFSVTWIVAFG